MQATLLNFGHCTRVVCDIMNKPMAIDIGQVVEADIHDAHFHMIKRAIKTDTLMVVPKESRISDKLRAVIDLLKSAEDETYDVVLKRFNEVVTHDEEEPNFRPNRQEMLRKLADLARYEVAKALHMQSQVFIREEGDEVTRVPIPKQDDHGDGMLKEIIQPGPEPAPPPAPPAPAKKAEGKKRTSKPKPPPVVKTGLKRERL